MKNKSFKLQILFALVLIPALGWLWMLRGQAAELSDIQPNYSIYLPFARYSVITWEEVGDGSATGKGISEEKIPSVSPSLASAPDGSLYIAWEEDATSLFGDIYVLHWNGQNWEEVGSGSASGGGISNSGGQSLSPKIAVAPDGTPYVSWHQYHDFANSDIYIRRWDGNSWVEIGEGSASGGGISNSGYSYNPTIVIAPDGTPYIAWEGFLSSDLYVRRWDGNNWVEVGSGFVSSVGTCSDAQLAFDSNGTPYIAWRDGHVGGSEIYIRMWDGSEWVEVGSGSASGGGISNTGQATSPSLSLAPDGTPYVSWKDIDMSNGIGAIYIRRWNGNSWEEVGANSASGPGISALGVSEDPSLAIAPDGAPYVVWQVWQSLEEYEIYIRRWDGSAWIEIGEGSASGGGVSNTFGYSLRPDVAIALDGTPYVAWYDNNTGTYGGDSEIYIRSFDGIAWIEVGVGSASGSGISGGSSSNAFNPSLTFSSDGIPYVTWENEDSADIFVLSWDGYQWVNVGWDSAISNNPGVSSHPSIVGAPGTVQYIAWEENNAGNFEIYIRQWNGDGIDWTETGSGSASDGGISNTPGQSQFPVLAATQEGILYLAWQDDSSGNAEIYIRQWDGSTWTEIGAGSATGGGVSNTSNASTHPALALSAAGVPYLAWEEAQAGNVDIYIRQWDGSNWVEVGTGSASEGGISNNAGASLNPALVVSPDGFMYVAWEDTSSGDSQIYVRQWDGSSWVEVGIGSASGGGISLIGASTAPSIGVSFTRVPMVSWSAAPAGLCCEIYVLQWNGTQWVEVGETSASNGGISNTSGISAHPVLAFAPNGNVCVVWEDDTSGNFEIYIRRYPLSPFPFE